MLQVERTSMDVLGPEFRPPRVRLFASMRGRQLQDPELAVATLGVLRGPSAPSLHSVGGSRPSL